MISSDYMYASSAFQSEPMESEYLKDMDTNEKEIVENEDEEIKTKFKSHENNWKAVGTIVGGMVSSIIAAKIGVEDHENNESIKKIIVKGLAIVASGLPVVYLSGWFLGSSGPSS